MTWATTYTGNRVDLLDPSPQQISIEDIAHALAYLPRFTGHTSEFYSVAQHCVLVSRLCPPELRLKGLLHDAHEAYISDWSTPLKQALAVLCPAGMVAFRQMEGRLVDAIGEAFAVDLTHDRTVKHFDRVALRVEAETLLPEPIHGHEDLPDDPCEPVTPWTSGVAKSVFLRTFQRLTRNAAAVVV